MCIRDRTELRTLLHILRDSPGADDAGEAAEDRGSASGLTTGSLHGVVRTLESSLRLSLIHI